MILVKGEMEDWICLMGSFLVGQAGINGFSELLCFNWENGYGAFGELKTHSTIWYDL
jgi:hypothetical protein